MDSATLRSVGAAFEAMLLQQCLAPLANGAGPVGSVGMASLAQAIAERDEAGFGAALATQLADRVR